MTAWIIRKTSDDMWIATEAGKVRARIYRGDKPKAAIAFPQAPAFDIELHGADLAEARQLAFGYVRGIERATAVHAAETRKKGD